MTNNFADVNGIKICYDIRGEGPPIILTHGYGAKKEIWKAQYELVREFQLITYDIRGVGKSDRPNMPYTMEMFADDIKGLRDFLNIKKAHIAGRSLGGMISQNFVLKYPEKVDKLILITTNCGMPSDDGIEMLKNTQIKDLEELKIDPKKSFFNQARILYHQKFRKEMENDPERVFHGIFSAESLMNERLIDMPRPQDLSNIAEAIRNHETIDRLHEIKCPTLLIAGTHDRLTPKSASEIMNQKIPNSMLKIIERAGHFLTLSRAPEVNRIISDFLKS